MGSNEPIEPTITKPCYGHPYLYEDGVGQLLFPSSLHRNRGALNFVIHVWLCNWGRVGTLRFSLLGIQNRLEKFLWNFYHQGLLKCISITQENQFCSSLLLTG